ncbi:hypothetical protein [Sinobaca sp. H24]|nr:hypothetical protein [Sinobaca sp. H24]
MNFELIITAAFLSVDDPNIKHLLHLILLTIDYSFPVVLEAN